MAAETQKLRVNGHTLPTSLSRRLGGFPFGMEVNSLVAMAVFPREVVSVALEEHRNVTEYFHSVVAKEGSKTFNKLELACTIDFSRSLSSTILQSPEDMEQQTEKYRPYAPFECGLWLKDSSTCDDSIELPYLDIDSTIVLSTDESGVRYALDYRGPGSEPSVVARYFSDHTLDYGVPAQALGWHQIATTFDEFLDIVRGWALDRESI